MAANPDKPRRKPRHRKSKPADAQRQPSRRPEATGIDGRPGAEPGGGSLTGLADFAAEPVGTTETRLVIQQLRARADGTIGGRHRPRSD